MTETPVAQEFSPQPIFPGPSVLVAATLVCTPWEKRGLIVIDVEVPGQSVLEPVRQYYPEWQIEERELQWPQDMVERLVDFRNEIQSPVPGIRWNCHVFGGWVTGQAGEMEMRGRDRLLNAIPGPEISGLEMQNGERYGIYSRFLGSLTHTVVATQEPGMCLHSLGCDLPIMYSDIGTVQRTYPGKIRPYTYGRREGR